MLEFFLFQNKTSAAATVAQTPLPALSLSKKAADILPATIAFEYGVVPLYEYEDKLLCASPSESIELKQLLSFHCNRPIQLRAVTPDQLQELLYALYSPDDQTLYGLLRTIPEQGVQEDPESQSTLTYSAEGRFFLSLLDYSFAHVISDIHLLPHPCGTYIKVRREGQFLEHPEPILSLSSYAKLLQQLKIEASLPLYTAAKPGSGSIRYTAYGEARVLRLSILPGPHAESVVIRLPACKHTPELSQLTLPPRIIEYLKNYLRQRTGMLLICGPTGGGKTTLLYALIQEALKQQLHTITVEDPVELDIPGVCQTECTRSEMAEYCIAALRHDPDLLVPGEIRDATTASIAFDAALSGHGVIATVHAGNAQDARERLQQFGIATSCYHQALAAIIHIQLIPRLCSYCSLTHETASRICGTSLRQRSACSNCNFTGYSGQLPLIELQDSRGSAGKGATIFNTKSYLEKLLYAGTIDIDTYMRIQSTYDKTTTETQRMFTHPE